MRAYEDAEDRKWLLLRYVSMSITYLGRDLITGT
jgi:hypothetical protein